MKILFFCGSLEPGRDGVGDYVRRLCEELVKSGHQIGALALNDRHRNEEWSEELILEGGTLFLHSLPAIFAADKRNKKAAAFVSTFEPDVISLQFVIFGYQKKGLPFLLAHFLHSIGKDVKWHIMFHEIWVGLSKDASLKFRLWGFLQKQIINSMIRVLKPGLVSTQARLYRAELLKLIRPVKILPLFPNIPLSSGRTRVDKQSQSKLQFLLFGMIHPLAPVSMFTRELALYSARHKKMIKINFVGRNGAQLPDWLENCSLAGLESEVFGERTPGEISELLFQSDFGISTSPHVTIEKSGTVAAMREHGLRVLCVASYWEPREPIEEEGLAGVDYYTEGSLDGFIGDSRSNEPVITLKDVAKQFINDLKDL